MQPRDNGRLLPQMALRITSNFLILGDIWLLKIVATAQQQQLKGVFRPCVPVELRGCSRAFSKIVKFFWFGRIKEPA